MTRLLLFTLGEYRYAIDISLIQEIIDLQPLHFIPCVPRYYRGAINFHGEAIPVLDMENYLGLQQNEQNSRILVLTRRTATLALMVETARKIVNVEQLEVVHDTLEPFENTARGTAVLDGVPVFIFDIERLLLSLTPSGYRGATGDAENSPSQTADNRH